MNDLPQTQEWFGLIQATFLEHISYHLVQYKLMQHPTVQVNKTSQDSASNCCVKIHLIKHCPVQFTYFNTFNYKSLQYYSFISIFPIGFSIKVLYAFSLFSISTIVHVQLTIFLTNFWCILSFIFFLHSILTMLYLTCETWNARSYISHLYKTSSKTIIFCLLPYYVMFGKSQSKAPCSGISSGLR